MDGSGQAVEQELREVVDLQESLLPVNPNKPREEQWLMWIVVAAILLYSLAVGLGLVVSAVNGGSTEWAFPLMSVPCFVTAGWYGYAYIAARSSRRDGGLAFSGVGWAAVGMAFLFKRDLSPAVSVWSTPSFWWTLLAIACIISGAIVSIVGRRRALMEPEPLQPPAPNPSPHPPEQKKE